MIYSFTFVWLLIRVRRWRKIAAFITALTSIAIVGEMVLIALQAARGVPSHFNLSTPFDAAVYDSMGAFAGLLSAGAFVAAILLLFERKTEKGYRLNIEPVGSQALHHCLPTVLWEVLVATAGDPGPRMGVFHRAAPRSHVHAIFVGIESSREPACSNAHEYASFWIYHLSIGVSLREHIRASGQKPASLSRQR